MTKERITLFRGGSSSERDVSLASGVRIAQALRERGYRVTPVDPAAGPLTPAAEQALLAGGVVKAAPPSQVDLKRRARESPPRLVRNITTRNGTQPVCLGLHGC